MRNASSKKTALDSQQYQVNLCRFMESLTARMVYQVLTLKTKKMSEDLNKHRQVKGVDSITALGIYTVNNKVVSMPDLTGTIIDLMKEYPNDADLGKKVRRLILNYG
jgi:hypothetical protein